jgi:hypothetical protein
VYGGQPETSTPPRGSSRHGKRGKRRPILIGVTAVVLAIVAGIGAFVEFGHKAPVYTTGFVPTGSTPTQDAQQITAAFLHAWHTGDFATAAKYTNNPAAASAALAVYQKDLHLRSLSGSVSGVTAAPVGAAPTPTASADAATMPPQSVKFAITVSIAAADGAKALRGTWSYHSSLVTYQQPKTPVWYIVWNPDVVAPNLTAKTHLAAISVPPKVLAVTDSSGNYGLETYNDVGLSNIARLMKQAAPPGKGKPGLDVEIQTAAGKAVANSAATVVPTTNVDTLTTTIDQQAETAAVNAVAMHKMSSMVVIQPSTGHILAIANNNGFNDFALTAEVAPGSTMKVITSTALFNGGVLNPNTPVECPKVYTVQGITYHNDQGETLPAGTPFITDFAQSCNNAFSSQWPHLSGQLAGTAKQYYGLNQKWDIGISGISASYFNAPADASGSELAQEAFGQGSLTASPLAMASVAATVDFGAFKQPILLAGTKQATARPLPASTDADLKQLMQAVVTSGTAAGLGFGPTVYGKTGTADIQPPGVKTAEKPNSWFIAFDTSKDVAIACLVLNSGYGAKVAAPEVKAFLDSF